MRLQRAKDYLLFDKEYRILLIVWQSLKRREVVDEKKTYGQRINEHRAQNIGYEDDIIEYRRSMEPAILAEKARVIEEAKNSPVYYNKDFYVVLITTFERVGNAAKYIVIARQSCPTPTYKQSVWKYRRASDTEEFLWSIPSGVLYYHILHNAQKYLLDAETKQLAQFVVLMESGELLEWVKKENGEKRDAVIFLNKENACLMN